MVRHPCHHRFEPHSTYGLHVRTSPSFRVSHLRTCSSAAPATYSLIATTPKVWFRVRRHPHRDSETRTFALRQRVVHTKNSRNIFSPVSPHYRTFSPAQIPRGPNETSCRQPHPIPQSFPARTALFRLLVCIPIPSKRPPETASSRMNTSTRTNSTWSGAPPTVESPSAPTPTTQRLPSPSTTS